LNYTRADGVRIRPPPPPLGFFLLNL